MVNKAFLSALRHAATTLAGALGAIQIDPLNYFNVDFGKALLASLIAAGLAGGIRFLQRVGEEEVL